MLYSKKKKNSQTPLEQKHSYLTYKLSTQMIAKFHIRSMSFFHFPGNISPLCKKAKNHQISNKTKQKT